MSDSVNKVQIYFTKGDGNSRGNQSPSKIPPNQSTNSPTRNPQQPGPSTSSSERIGRAANVSLDQVEVYSTDFSKPVRPSIKRHHRNPNDFDDEKVVRSNICRIL